MSRFFRSIVQRLTPGSAPRAPGVFVGAFGKHPGWNDHIDDIGLETDALVSLKQIFYVQGIAGNIDAGAWDKLDATGKLDGFSHLLLRRVGTDLIAGRFWSSRDGKGRDRYPMFVVAHASGVSLDWVVRSVFPALAALQQQCCATTDAASVRMAVEASRSLLTGELVPAPPQSTLNGSAALRTLAMRPEMGQDAQGLLTLLYVVERELTGFRPGQFQNGNSIARHVRVPLCADTPAEAAALWLRFLHCQLDPAAPLAVLVPEKQGWVDLLAGEPGVSQLYCVRATARTVPLATDIPYKLDADFLTRARRQIDQARDPAPVA